MCIKQFFIKKYIPVSNAKELIFNNIDKSKIYKKIAILAGFSNNGKIPDKDLFYLKELNKSFDGIIIVFDSFIIENEINKIKDYIIGGIFKRHETYDFGSYKLGYKFLAEHHIIKELDTLLFTNDSCYGPIFPLDNIIQLMDGKTDFWGIIHNIKYHPHLQSWFICFNKKIIQSSAIENFLSNIKKFKLQHTYVKKYEIKFTEYLNKLGFTYDSYLPKSFDIKKFRVNHDMNLFPATLINKFNIPFIKVKSFTPFFYHINDQRKETLELIKKYNLELYNIIIKDLKSKSLFDSIK